MLEELANFKKLISRYQEEREIPENIEATLKYYPVFYIQPYHLQSDLRKTKSIF